ncbi:hypothetical protein OZ410_09210 [Robiginitalea sp. M366]|uniref:hypothetical protein n=1 Tax=Robiginitalea aestuariiviva TaxID=3036903 RepID=UPI00240D7E06|nr:hypothetical protein [Robiginitalea aestuariiviva]MDG1572493.1 hypothetical protein [Robiginitalea aestuariiviva]
MKYSILLVLFTLSTSCLGQKSAILTPEQLTLAFIQDYYDWNQYAFRTDEGIGSNEKAIEKKYRQIIRKYCIPNKDYQGITFGSESNHHPEHEQIVGTDVGALKTIVKTHFNDPKHPYSFADYEYHFLLSKGKWLLEEVYYVDGEEKYKAL